VNGSDKGGCFGGVGDVRVKRFDMSSCGAHRS